MNTLFNRLISKAYREISDMQISHPKCHVLVKYFINEISCEVLMLLMAVTRAGVTEDSCLRSLGYVFKADIDATKEWITNRNL